MSNPRRDASLEETARDDEHRRGGRIHGSGGRARHHRSLRDAFGNPQLSHDEVVTFHENASRLTHLLEVGFR